MNVEEEIQNSRAYLYYWIRMTILNAQIDEAKCSKHRLLTRDQFFNGFINTGKMQNEPNLEYQKRTFLDVIENVKTKSNFWESFWKSHNEQKKKINRKILFIEEKYNKNKIMKESTLFQYAVIWNPTEKQSKEGEKSKLIVEPKYILAQDLNSANMSAVMEMPSEYKSQLDQIKIAIRPF